MSDIFISYKREEQAVAGKLARALESQGWSVWWDPKLRAGERFNDVIEAALQEASCVIVVWSRLSVKSSYVKDEATFALKRGKLAPVIIEEVELPFRFEEIHTPHLIDWDGSEDSPVFKRLVNDVAAITGFFPRDPAVKASSPEEFLGIVWKTREELHHLYTVVYCDRPAPNWSVYMKVAQKLNKWDTIITNPYSFRSLAWELLGKGESADIYTISYMLRQSPDLHFFEPLVEELTRRKHRGTAVWQALSTLEEMLKDKYVVSLLCEGSGLRIKLITALKKLNDERPIKEGISYPFSGAKMWGKILQICRLALIPNNKVFDNIALRLLEDLEQV